MPAYLYGKRKHDQIDADHVIDVTATEAFKVQRNNDSGDVFIVDTTNRQVDVPASSKLRALDTTDATSGSTGAICTEGGIGATKGIYAGGAVDFQSTLGVQGVTTLAGTMTAQDAVTCETTLVCDDIDANSATTMAIGKSVATKVELADTGVETEVQGTLDVLGTSTLGGAGVANNFSVNMRHNDPSTMSMAVLVAGSGGGIKTENLSVSGTNRGTGILFATDVNSAGIGMARQDDNNCDMFFGVESGGTATEVGRFHSEGHLVLPNGLIIEGGSTIDDDFTVTADKSGGTFACVQDASEIVTATLPAVAEGLEFTFILTTASSTEFIISTDSGSTHLHGVLYNAGTATAVTAGTSVCFDASAAVVGDKIVFKGANASVWSVEGHSGNASGLS